MDDFEAAMAEIKEKFTLQLPPRLAEIEAAWTTLCEGGAEGPTASEAWTNLRHNVHYLAGSAATFGYVDMGDAAAEVQPLLDTAVANGGGAIADHWAEVSAAIDKITRG